MSPCKNSFKWSGPALVVLALAITPCSGFAQQSTNSQGEGERLLVSTDLQMIYGKTESASSVADYTAIFDFCRNVSGDASRGPEDRRYARSLMSWAANRRGEARSDRAGIFVREQRVSQAQELDALAKKDFETAVQLDPTRWRAHHNMAIARALQGDNQAALESLAAALKFNPEFVDAYFNRGEIYFRSNQFELAIQDQSKVIEMKPNDSAAYSARAHSLYAIGKSDEALDDYAKAMELSPDSSEAATEYADTCQALGKWKQAATAYQKAMQLDGQNVRSLQNAAWMMATCPDEFYRNGDMALETVQKAVQLASAPTSVHVLDVLAAAQAASGDFATAQSTISQALRLTSDATLRSELQMRGRQYQRKRPYLQPSPVGKQK
jgi:tetratricopeptide (TPR) repeat protein